MRHGQPSAVELASDVDCEDPIPLLWIDGVYTGCRSGDPSIVDQRIKSAQAGLRFIKKSGNLGAI